MRENFWKDPMKLDFIVDVTVSTRSIPVSTANAVLELVFQGFSGEVPTRNAQLKSLPPGDTTHRDVSSLWGHDFITVIVLVNRNVPEALMAELTNKAIHRVMLKIGDAIGMDIVDNAVEAVLNFAGTAKENIAQGLQNALAAARRKLLGEDE
jgi:hypothetical protein